MPNLFDKEKYVINYENFQLYSRLGLKLKIHCVLQINQSQWLKQYIEFNTKIRIEAEKIVTKMKKQWNKDETILCMKKQWKTYKIESI